MGGSADSSGDSHKLFGSMITIPPLLFSTSLLIIIGAVILVEIIFHVLRHWTKDSPFHKMLLALENELMIVGFTAFFIKIFVDTTSFLTEEQFFALEFADLIIPIFSFTHCFLGLLLIILTFRQNSIWSKAFHLTFEELLDSYYKESEEWHFRFTPQAFNIPLQTIEFRILHNIFCELFKIKRNAFDFDRYVELVFERFILSVIKLSPSNVLFLIIIVCLNMIRKTPNDIVGGSMCPKNDFECLNREAIIDFTIFGGILLAATLLLAFISRRYERLILSRRGINSWQQYPEVLEHMEAIRVGGLDEDDLKKALQKAKDLLFVEQEERKKFYKDLILFPFHIVMNAFQFLVKIRNRSLKYVSILSSTKNVDGDHLQVHPIESSIESSNPNSGEDNVEHLNTDDVHAGLMDHKSDKIIPTGSMKTALTTDEATDEATDNLLVGKDIKGVIAFAQMKKKLILLEEKAKERVAARKLESKKLKEKSEKESKKTPKSFTLKLFEGTPKSNKKDITTTGTPNNSSDNNKSNKVEKSYTVKVPRLQKMESIKFKLDSKGRIHSTFSNVTNVVGKLASTPTSFTRQFSTSIKTQNSVGTFVMGENNMACEDDIENIFFLSRPYIYFESVHLLSIIISIYQATWFTNFVAIDGNTIFKIISVIPFILCALLYVYIVKSAALLQAIYRVDYECVLEVMEAMESSRHLGVLIREKLLAFCSINIEELTTESKEVIKKLFMEIDDDGNGNLSRSEFAQFLNSLDIHFSKTKLKHLFTEIDLNCNNSISFEEFFIFIFPEHDEAKAIEMKRMSIVKKRVMKKATLRAVEFDVKLHNSVKKRAFSLSGTLSMKSNTAETNAIARSNDNNIENDNSNGNNITNNKNIEKEDEPDAAELQINNNNNNNQYASYSGKNKSFLDSSFASSLSSSKSNNHEVFNDTVQKSLGDRENVVLDYQVQDF